MGEAALGFRLFRLAGQFVLCVLGGTVLNAIAGSVIPALGTVMAIPQGAAFGAVASVVIVPLVYTREIRRAWLRVMLPAAVFAVCSVLLVWIVWLVANFSGRGLGREGSFEMRVFAAVYPANTYVSFLAYLAGAVWAWRSLPAVWPVHGEGRADEPRDDVLED